MRKTIPRTKPLKRLRLPKLEAYLAQRKRARRAARPRYSALEKGLWLKDLQESTVDVDHDPDKSPYGDHTPHA